MIQRFTKPADDNAQCEDLQDKVDVVRTELDRLKRGIDELARAEEDHAGEAGRSKTPGVTSIVAQAVGLVKDYLLGTSGSTIPDEASVELEGIMSDLFINDTVDLENRWDLVKAHLEHLEDHAKVVCAEGVRLSVVPEGETEPIDVEHGPVEAVLKLLEHLSPRPHDLPSQQEMRAEVALEQAEETAHFAPPAKGNTAPEFIVQGLPGVENGGVVGPVHVRLGYHQTSHGGLVLVWRCVLEMKENWYEASVDAVDLKVVSVVDWGGSRCMRVVACRRRRLLITGSQLPTPRLRPRGTRRVGNRNPCPHLEPRVNLTLTRTPIRVRPPRYRSVPRADSDSPLTQRLPLWRQRPLRRQPVDRPRPLGPDRLARRMARGP